MSNKIKNEFAYYLTNFFTVFLVNQKGVSNNTIKSYRDTFKILLKYYYEKKNIKIEKITINSLSKEIILEFLDYLEIEKHNSISTRNQRLACIHAFCKFIQMEEPIYIDCMQKILSIHFKKKIQKNINYLTPEAIKILLEQPNVSEKNGLRDLAIMSLLYDTGARVQELIDLKVKDIRIDSPSTVTLHGKGNKFRQVPIMNNTKKVLKKYIEKNKMQSNEYLFESNTDRKFTRNGIFYIINKYTKKANLISAAVPEKIFPHMFRHTKAMHLLQSGINLIYIRDFLGHVDIQTTEIYAKYDTETKRKAIEKAYPDLVKTDIPTWSEDNNLIKWLSTL